MVSCMQTSQVKAKNKKLPCYISFTDILLILFLGALLPLTSKTVLHIIVINIHVILARDRNSYTDHH